VISIADDIPKRHEPAVTTSLILTNVGVYLFCALLPADQLERVFRVFGVVPARLTHPDGLPDLLIGSIAIFVSLFLHGGLAHILFNMWFLWIFGRAVEDRLGSARFVFLYLVSGVAASATHILINSDSILPAIGASGAISGVMATYIVFFPRAQMVVIVPVLFFPLLFPLPAAVYVGVWFAIQLAGGYWSILSYEGVSNIAFWAHVGGFVGGLAVSPTLWNSADGRRALSDNECCESRVWAQRRRGEIDEQQRVQHHRPVLGFFHHLGTPACALQPSAQRDQAARDRSARESQTQTGHPARASPGDHGPARVPTVPVHQRPGQ